MASPNQHLYESTPSRWRAVSSRDASAHWSFIYGVKTTRIYCRPTCTARLARRANVVYFDTAEQAQHEGFRACTRCKPDDSGFLGQREEVVMRTLGLLRDRSGSVNVQDGVKALAGEVGVTPSYLCRVFKQTMGCTLGEYCRLFDEVQSSASGTGSTKSLEVCNVSEAATGHPEGGVSAIDLSMPEEISAEEPSAASSEPWLELEADFDTDFDFDDWT